MKIIAGNISGGILIQILGGPGLCAGFFFCSVGSEQFQNGSVTGLYPERRKIIKMINQNLFFNSIL